MYCAWASNAYIIVTWLELSWEPLYESGHIPISRMLRVCLDRRFCPNFVKPILQTCQYESGWHRFFEWYKVRSCKLALMAGNPRSLVFRFYLEPSQPKIVYIPFGSTLIPRHLRALWYGIVNNLKVYPYFVPSKSEEIILYEFNHFI